MKLTRYDKQFLTGLVLAATLIICLIRAANGDTIVQPLPPGSQVPQDQFEPRDLGNRAAMHIYWFAPATLEITHVETFLYKDEASCKDNVVHAAAIAMPHASHGDIVYAECVDMRLPESLKNKAPKKGEVDL